MAFIPMGTILEEGDRMMTLTLGRKSPRGWLIIPGILCFSILSGCAPVIVQKAPALSGTL